MCPRSAQRGGGRVRRRPGRVHIVNQDDPSRSDRGVKGSSHVAPPLDPGLSALPRRGPRPLQERHHRDRPSPRQLQGKPFGCVVPAPEPAIAVARHAYDRRRVWSRHAFDDNSRRPSGQQAQTAFLPRGDDAANGRVVFDRRAGACERQTAAVAFTAASNRPRRRVAAAFAERRLDSSQRRRALTAHLRPRRRADQAALGKQQVEHSVTLGRRLCRECVSPVNIQHARAGLAPRAGGCPPRAADRGRRCRTSCR
jgi:hypothetical protein